MFTCTGCDYQFHVSQYGTSPEVSPEIENPARWKLSYGNDPAPVCPRCASSNTKFCYYNNYSLSQPRYFCKGCRRYWTKGGTLRNVPIGGGCRKSRRRSSNNKRFGRINNLRDERNDRNPDEEFQASPGSDGSEIDLAVVFAKFLNNQSPCSTYGSRGTTTSFDQESPNNESNGVATTFDVSDSFNWNISQENDVILSFYDDLDQTQKSGLIDDQVSNLMPREDQEKQRQREALETSMLGLQDFLNDEEIQDVLWSDNWDSLDLEGFDICLKP